MVNYHFTHYTAKLTTLPSNVTVCTGGVAVFTCVMDKHGTNITSDDLMWEQIRVGGHTSTLRTIGSFNITTTISGDTLTSTLTITGATDNNTLGTSLYHCVVSDMISRNAAINFATGNKYCVLICTVGSQLCINVNMGSDNCGNSSEHH